MCAIGGIVFRDRTRQPDAAILKSIGDAMAHRGPDDAGEMVAPGVGLVSRRLAIIDPSPAGHMPMSSEDGQVAVVLNGEIYNHVELREELKRRGVRLRSGSDTEVLLNMYLAEGIDAVGRLVGMFAFAVWDARRQALFLVRDRIGVKPLLYRLSEDGLRFASEMRGFLAEPGFSPEPDPEAIHHLLALRMVPHPRTVFRPHPGVRGGAGRTETLLESPGAGGGGGSRPGGDLRALPIGDGRCRQAAPAERRAARTAPIGWARLDRGRLSHAAQPDAAVHGVHRRLSRRRL
jgi:asparagine synthase (glutamine-hydrolysing)